MLTGINAFGYIFTASDSQLTCGEYGEMNLNGIKLVIHKDGVMINVEKVACIDVVHFIVCNIYAQTVLASFARGFLRRFVDHIWSTRTKSHPNVTPFRFFE